ncbi:hypothetical protein CLF_108681 [Clonorchis sinensis]|uniref:Uncharacterized protein n=1 Tax=Clonorchis sinensis TaxID=79923 RepID=G7YIE5_CLOSI|nr:hypothetical protein CLF_108681 [Clonorchis sinensis]
MDYPRTVNVKIGQLKEAKRGSGIASGHGTICKHPNSPCRQQREPGVLEVPVSHPPTTTTGHLYFNLERTIVFWLHPQSSFQWDFTLVYQEDELETHTMNTFASLWV